MKFNYKTCLSGKKCILVPYRPEHVVTYHEWMQDPYLLDMTASEPLSLEDEKNMQQSWMKDEDKCTFIILAKNVCDLGILKTCLNEKEPLTTLDSQQKIIQLHHDFTIQNLGAMIGDVNLFITREQIQNEDEEEAEKNMEGNMSNLIKNSPIAEAELDVMIAEEQYRRQGFGSDAVRVMMIYGAEKLNISRFFVKIKESNKASQRMFIDALGFHKCNYSDCFKEVELEFVCKNVESLKNIRKSICESVIQYHISDN